MRVAYISSYPPKRCGIAEYSASLVTELRKVGHEVLVIGDTESSSADVAADLGSRQGLATVDAALARFKPDVLHLQWEPGLFTRRARMKLPKWWGRQRAAKVVTLHSLATVVENSPRGRISAFLSRSAERRLLRASPQRVSVTTGLMAKMLVGRANGLNAAVTPLGVDPTRAPRTEMSSTAPCLCFGFIAPGKRIEVVVGAARLAPDRRFVIVGEPAGPRGARYLAELQALAKGLPNVDLRPGWVDDAELDAWLSQAFVTLLPVTADYRGSAALTRSISRGVPVIAPKGSGVAALIEETGAGEVAAGSDSAHLAEALERLSANRLAASAGVLRAQEAWGWSRLARTFSSLYTDASGERGGANNV